MAPQYRLPITVELDENGLPIAFTPARLYVRGCRWPSSKLRNEEYRRSVAGDESPVTSVGRHFIPLPQVRVLHAKDSIMMPTPHLVSPVTAEPLSQASKGSSGFPR